MGQVCDCYSPDTVLNHHVISTVFPVVHEPENTSSIYEMESSSNESVFIE